jgi:hypothetical protein
MIGRCIPRPGAESPTPVIAARREPLRIVILDFLATSSCRYLSDGGAKSPYAIG